MPKLIKRQPKMCNDRGRSYSWHDGKRIWHGVTGTAEAKKNYDRFIHEITREPTQPVQCAESGVGPAVKIGSMIVAELADEFLKYHTPRLHTTAKTNE